MRFAGGASALPPGPRTPRLWQTYQWLTGPTRVFDRCVARYGEIFTLRVWPAGTLVYVAAPDAARQVFTGDPDVFHAGEAYELMEPVGGKRSLFLLDEDDHIRMRKLLLPPFHGDRLKRWTTLIEELTEQEMRRWPVGKPFALRPSTEAITLEVIMRLVFGIREPARAAELGALLPRLFEVGLLLAPSFVWPALRRDLGRWSPWGRFARLREQIDELLYDEIRLRRSELAKDSGTQVDERDDVLSMLISARDEQGRELTDAELRDELVTILLAGHETTASSLSWVFERLLRHPAALERLIAELDAGDEDGAYMDAVIKETLRSRPVGAHVARKLTADAEIGGHALPRGATVAVSIYLIHHSPKLFPEPHAFRPERFLDGQPPSYAWIPFGGGVRRCLGAGLATLEMRTAIATILRTARLRAASATPEEPTVLGVTIVPSRGAEVVVEGWRRPQRRATSAAAVRPLEAGLGGRR